MSRDSGFDVHSLITRTSIRLLFGFFEEVLEYWLRHAAK